MAESKKRIHRAGIDAEVEGSDYFEKRQLQGGVAGWILLAGLGVERGDRVHPIPPSDTPLETDGASDHLALLINTSSESAAAERAPAVRLA